jgi:sensor histidine kinase regulating citrate/malate metabolism
MIVIMNHIIRAGVDINIIKQWLPVFELIVLILAILGIVSIKSLAEHDRERIKSNLTKSNLQQVESLLQVSRTEKHEFNRHLQDLQALIYLNRNAEAIQYIDGISELHWSSEIIELSGQPIITGLLNSKYHLARSQGIDFAVSLTSDFANLAIEPWDLSSILGNLIDNAMEAALQDKSPRVGVEFKHTESTYLIYIHNNGSVIKKAEIEKVFEAGFTTKNSQGRGYGLFIARTLVMNNGGKIECNSNKSTTFLVSLPDRGQ